MEERLIIWNPTKTATQVHGYLDVSQDGQAELVQMQTWMIKNLNICLLELLTVNLVVQAFFALMVLLAWYVSMFLGCFILLHFI